MEFRLLGPLEVEQQGRRLAVGGSRRQAVLATLLLHANQTVTASQLANSAWPEPPRAAESNLRTYVAQIRAAFDAIGAGEPRLTTESNGYRIVVAEDELDLAVFDRLCDAATRTIESDPGTALDHLVRARRLWRGEPLAGLAVVGPLLQAEIARLEGRRLAVAELWADAALACGRHEQVAVELEYQVRSHPLRERLWAQLMLALYRCGRRGDALAAYQEVYRILSGELGVTPGAELQRLHERVLREDTGLDAPAPGPATVARSTTRVAPVRPRQLPADVVHFTGRERHLGDLDALLPGDDVAPSGPVVISAIAGTPGVGKSALAVHWAHRVADRFPGGQLYVNLRGFDPTRVPMTPAEAVRGFLDGLGVAPQRIPIGVDAQAALYRSLLADRHTLVVLDNALDPDQVRPLLPGSPHCLIVVTSRNQMAGLVTIDSARPLLLDLLAPAEARDLLARRLGPARVAAEPEAVDDIVELCVWLPLALAVVAARAALNPDLPLTTIGDELRATRASLDAFAGEDAASDVRAVFSWSYRALTTDAARLFRLLGLHPGPDITGLAAASLAATTVPRAHSLLAELAEAHLVTEHPPGRYAFHDLLRAYATELANNDDEPERRAALHRLLDHYVHTAHAAATHLASQQREPITLAAARSGVSSEVIADHDRAMRWFTAERPVILAVAGRANDAGFPAHTCQLSWSLREFLVRRGRWDDLRAVETLALAAARALADRRAQASAHFGLGLAATRQGRDDDAHRHYSISLDLYRDLGDRVTEAKIHVNLSSVVARQGRLHDALDHSRQALRIFRAVRHQTGQANALNSIGWYEAQLGRHRQAINHCRRALALLRGVGDQMNEAAVWDTLGYAHQGLGAQPDAIDCYLRAVELTRAAGDRYREADGLSHLADAHLANGDPGPARAAWQAALAILDELGHPDADRIRARLDRLDTTRTPPRTTG